MKGEPELARRLHLGGLGAVLSGFAAPGGERHERAVGDRRDSVLRHEGQELGLLGPGVQFDLVVFRQRQVGGADLLDMRFGVVAHSNGLRPAPRLQIDKRTPFVHALGSARRRVDEVEIDVIQPQRRKRRLEGRDRLVVALGSVTPGRISRPELCSHVEIRAVKASSGKAILEAPTYSGLVPVGCSGVDMAIPGSDRGCDGHRGVLVGNEIGAEPDLGQRCRGLAAVGGMFGHLCPPTCAPEAGAI